MLSQTPFLENIPREKANNFQLFPPKHFEVLKEMLQSTKEWRRYMGTKNNVKKYLVKLGFCS